MPADTVDPLKDGRVKIVSENRTWTLRRPLLGEYRTLRLRLREIQDAKLERNEAVVGETPDKPAEDADPEEKVAYVKAVREQNRRAMDETEEANAEWVELVFNGDGNGLKPMADKPLPDDRAEWPLFVLDDSFIDLLVGQWRAVPLARGAGSD